MNHNCIFSKKEQPVEIFQFDVSKNMPFSFEKVSEIHTTDILDRPVTRVVYECHFDSGTVEICDKDYIVIGSRKYYHNGEMRISHHLEAHTKESIKEDFLTYDEYEEEYLDDIFDAFKDVPDEPSMKDILEIEKDIDSIESDAKRLTLDDIFDDEDF